MQMLAMEQRIQAPSSILGDGLLHGIEDGREQLIEDLVVAYGNVGDREQNFAVYIDARQRIVDTLKQRFQALGLTAAHFDWDRFWSRVDLDVPATDRQGHVALVRALLTVYQARFCQHIVYRLQHEGNVHLSISGPTGMGKSSCAIALADWIKPYPQPTDLLHSLSYDLGELPYRLKKLGPGDTGIQDEYSPDVGEGANTARAIFTKLDDQLRATQVNLIRLSPRRQEGGAMQAHLELILWNPERGFSVFLVWLDDHPAGIIAIPWCRRELYAVYKPWKTGNVERVQAGETRDNRVLIRATVQLFQDERFVAYLMEAVNKPKPPDFRIGFETFYTGALTTGQAEKLVPLAYNLCAMHGRLSHRFRPWFGLVTPQEHAQQPMVNGEYPLPVGLQDVANKWYTE